MGAKEVAAGAEWLDEVSPGWEREIDLGKLNIHNRCACICGQSLAKFVIDKWSTGYEYALRVAGTNGSRQGWKWAIDHGFDLEENEPLWRELIKERFSTGNLSDDHV